MKPPTSELVLDEEADRRWRSASDEPATVPRTDALADEALESLFSATNQEAFDDVDAFWESISNEDVKPELASGDSLSYDQAAKLGLAPDED